MALKSFFSEQYINHNAVKDNILLLWMYRLAYPFSIALKNVGFSPNQITSLSILFSVITFCALVLNMSWGYCAFFWGLATLLDFCDGTVARMTNKVSEMAFRYDHMSDLFKICLLIFGVGIRYQNIYVWEMVFASSFFFLYADLLSYQLDTALDARLNQKLKFQPNLSVENVQPIRLRERSKVAAYIVKREKLLSVLVNTHSALFTVHGHTLLLFIFVGVNYKLALIALAYFSLLNIRRIKINITQLIQLPKLA